MFSSILILCIGNICRSPLAEALLRDSLQGHQNIHVSSAGLHALVDHPADKFACMIAEENELQIKNHCSRQVNQSLLKKSDLILVMTRNQLKQIHRDFPETRGKVFMLLNNPAQDIPDPYRQGEETFRATWELIRQGVNNWVSLIGSSDPLAKK